MSVCRSDWDENALRVLGIDGTTGRPLASLPAVEVRSWAEAALGRPRPPRYGVATGDLRSAGWGVVLVDGFDPALREALEPLLRQRQKQAGDRFREMVYRPGEGPVDFRSRLRAGIGRVDPRQVPWYLLLVGDPNDLPHGFELDLDVPHAVGRLAFDEIDDLAAYARRVVETEERTKRISPRAAVFAPTHADDAPTAACAEHLARPLAGLLSRRNVPTTSAIGEGATRARLLELLEGDPALLVVVGHAVVYPKGHRSQRARQGAIVCADWPGPVRWPRAIPPRHTVSAMDLPRGAADGGVALLFGCHTAGTPRRDVFDSVDLEKGREMTSQPFVAALAQRLLGRDGRALAVIGHVGRAFEASCVWRGVGQAGPFEDALNALLDGRRMGEALDGFGQRFAEFAVTWARSRMIQDAAVSDPLALWVALHDARSWSLLGDPAVRLQRGAAKNGLL